MPIVILKDKDGERVLPIWVGIFEANAIALQIENIATPRPMTHDLLRNIITDLDGQVDRVVVSRPQGQHLLRHHPPHRQGERVVDRRASERRHRAGAADAVADPGGGDGHRQRQDRRLHVRARRQRPAAEVAREPRPRRAREVQDVESRQSESPTIPDCARRSRSTARHRDVGRPTIRQVRTRLHRSLAALELASQPPDSSFVRVEFAWDVCGFDSIHPLPLEWARRSPTR